MKARAVDWLLFAFVTFEFISGLGSFLVGRAEGRAIFWIHTLVGLSTLLLLLWKFRRVRMRVVQPRRWQMATLVSVLTAALVLVTIGSGVVWATIQRPLGYPNGMILHTASAIGLMVLMLWHQVLRFKPLRRRDVVGRRTATSVLGLFAFGGLFWTLQEAGNKVLQSEGANRRFTGSRQADPGVNRTDFPVTMWMFDNPGLIFLNDWRLTVDGAVDQVETFSLAELSALPQISMEATIDCTGGWYSTQMWTGIGIGDLLSLCCVLEDAQWVSFRSVTGYRWSLPLAEARNALLATHVAGEPLSHGHGAPLRLVAPGRRGFQWVKWVNEVHLLPRPDVGQWGVIFTSGLSK